MQVAVVSSVMRQVLIFATLKANKIALRDSVKRLCKDSTKRLQNEGSYEGSGAEVNQGGEKGLGNSLVNVVTR